VISGPDCLEWRRSSMCDGGACVEVARDGDVIMVRRSDEPEGASIAFDAKEWQKFISQIRTGRSALS
jgi:hypothetical protein